MPSPVDDTISAMRKVHLEGNIIPMEWFNHITLESGKPDTNSILLLSDIVYWYRPTVVRDESSGVILGYQKKFKADLLQKSYQDYESLFGFSKKQIRDSFVRLEDMGLICRVFRTVDTPFGCQGNVMFIELFPAKLIEITHRSPPIAIDVKRGLHERKEGITSKSQALDIKVKTYTKITPKTTSETTAHTPNARVDVSLQMLEVWNETLKPSCPVQMTSSRSSRLKAVLGEYFQEDLSQWKAFCADITRSSFLMGKGGRGWRVTLDWILDSHNLLKTLEGNYKDPVSSFQDKVRLEEDVSQRAQEHVTGLGDPLDQQFSLGLIKALGASTYLSWFKDVQIKREGHHLSVVCPTRFTCSYIQTNFSQVVFSVAQSLFSELEGVTYITNTRVASSPSLVSSQKEETNPERPNDALLAFLSSSGGTLSKSPGRWTASSAGIEEKAHETKLSSPCSGSLGDKLCVL